MNQPLIVLALTLGALSGCAGLSPKPEPGPSSDLARVDSPLSPLEPNAGAPSPDRPQTVPNPSGAPSEEMKIVLKDKNGRPVESSAPGSGLPPASEPIKPLAPTATQTEFSVGGVPILSDQDFEEANPSVAARIPGPVPADKAISWMKNGNRRFVRGLLRRDGTSKKDILKAATGKERPHTAVFSCSDSRLPPEVIFDQKLGELFVVRNHGLVVDSQVVSSLEHAIDTLGSNFILIFAAKECLADNASHSRSPTTAAAGSTSSPLSREAFEALAETGRLLRDQSRKIRAAIEAGTLKIQLGLYDLKQGSVTFKEH